MADVYVLWDESHIWGLLAWRAVRTLGFPCRLVRAADIAQGLLSGKQTGVLVVPGGVARRKADRLGRSGLEAIRVFVRSGGAYLGFCGGAGMGLTGSHGLGLCPWRRAAMEDRLLHLVSGHIHVRTSSGHPLAPVDPPADILVPVWWPARFDPESGQGVDIVATYAAPGPDFYIADLPLAHLPEGTFAAWASRYGIRLRRSFLTGQPCAVYGRYGHGRYLLSYSHLETPRSPQANAWLRDILSVLACETAETNAVALGWDMSDTCWAWEEPSLLRAYAMLETLLCLGREHFLLFDRNPWLLGWRSGIPGASLNNLRSLLHQALKSAPTPAAHSWLQAEGPDFVAAMERFCDEVRAYLLAERLAMTLASSYPDLVPRRTLDQQRSRLFGAAMEQGGLYAVLLDMLDETIWRLLSLT